MCILPTIAISPNLCYYIGCSFNNMTRSCPVPLAPENGAVDVTGVQPIVARYSCYDGTLVGSEIRTCLHNGSWSGVEPFCMTGMNALSKFL